MECLDANAVQDLMADALEAGMRAQVMGHLDTCADCRELVGVIAKDTIRESQPGTQPGAATEPPSGFEATMMPSPALDSTMPGGDVTGLEATRAIPSRPSMMETKIETGPTLKVAVNVGRTLGRYTLVEKLGSGAMGIVYLAEDRELSRKVAVKLLHRPDEALTERLKREARSMAQVNHPNVVSVYDVGEADDLTTYIAMELVQGDSLRTWQQTSRSVTELVEAYVGAGRGLAAAHASGIVHRDFKPDNVLVGKDGRVRVTDFGLAAARPSDGGEVDPLLVGDLSMTREGTVLGTPAYMAPEQFEGINVDARTDQFNFCVALYEALYGERPFAGKSYDELLDNVLEGKIKAAPANTKVSNALRAIVLRGMSTKPGDRYPTMDHLLDDLGRDRARPWRWAAFAAAALAVLLGIGLGADFVVRNRLARETEQSFQATAKQADRTVKVIVKLNESLSGQVYLFGAMGLANAFRDEAEFGLGTPETDAANFETVHQSLVDADWQFTRAITTGTKPSILAVGDYKGRLFYSSATNEWKTDLTRLPSVRQAMGSGKANNMRLVRYDDPDLVATKVLGATPPVGMGVMFTRTGPGGNSTFLQIIDANEVLEHISLDDTFLSIVPPEGRGIGTVPPELEHVPATDRIHEVAIGRATYQVLAKPIIGPDKELVGRIVMASRVDGVLSLFPRARAVFAVAMLVAIGSAIALFVRARHMAGGHMLRA